MARWRDVVEAEPEFAAVVKARFDAHKHKLLATLRRDGAPRISGIETTFVDGDLWLGMMPGSRKLHDLRRDGRFALHTSSEDPPDEDPGAWPGDAKLSGTAIEEHDPARRARVLDHSATGGQPHDAIPVFRLDITEAVLMFMGDPPDHMVVQLWRPGSALKAVKRA